MTALSRPDARKSCLLLPLDHEAGSALVINNRAVFPQPGGVLLQEARRQRTEPDGTILGTFLRMEVTAA